MRESGNDEWAGNAYFLSCHHSQAGILTLFIQHTSAALSINENYDPTCVFTVCETIILARSLASSLYFFFHLDSVRKDMDMAMDRIVPESLP